MILVSKRYHEKDFFVIENKFKFFVIFLLLIIFCYILLNHTNRTINPLNMLSHFLTLNSFAFYLLMLKKQEPLNNNLCKIEC